jgi:hypothetical protein
MTNPDTEPLAPTRARRKVCSLSKKTKWTDREDEMLMRLVGEHSSANWGEFASMFPGKTTQQISERWGKVLNPTLVKGSWTREEDETIIKFVQQCGPKPWSKLTAVMPGRTGKQCRERWKDHLNPDKNPEPFSGEEDAILIDLHEKMGNQWVKIAEFLPGRSDNAIKNRWNATLKKRLEYAKTGTPRPKRGRPSLRNAPKSADDIPKPPKMDEVIASAADKYGSVKLATPHMMSPFAGIKSPFAASPMIQDFAAWSPSQDRREFLGGSPFTGEFGSMLSPGYSISENRMDVMNSLFSPLLKK